jgi:uncharacterized membrane-anchored protein YhcB (DUF1043 family)
MTYLRIDRNKFWGWVVVSLLVGLGIGFGTMLLLTSSRSDEVRTLNNRIGAVQAQLTSAETSLTALTDQNAQLTLNLETANAQIASLQGSSSTDQSSTPTPTTVAVKVTSRTVTPSSVVASQNVTLTMTAKVTGAPTKVTMRIYNASKSYDKTFTLKKVSTSGKTQTWRATTKAPKAIGTYRYFATATKDGASVTMTGASAGTLKVK